MATKADSFVHQIHDINAHTHHLIYLSRNKDSLWLRWDGYKVLSGMDGGRCGDADRCWGGRNRGMCSKMVGWWCWGLRHGDGGLSVRVVPTYVHTVKHPVWFPRCHSAIQLSRATIELFFFFLSLTSLPVPSRVGDCFLILDPCH